MTVDLGITSLPCQHAMPPYMMGWFGGQPDRQPSQYVLGGTLQACSTELLTGFFRDGCCNMLSVRDGNRAGWRTTRNRIGSKSVDFAVIDPAGRVMLVIELNDSSHDRPERRDPDKLVRAALNQAGIHLTVFRPGQPLDLTYEMFIKVLALGNRAIARWAEASLILRWSSGPGFDCFCLNRPSPHPAVPNIMDVLPVKCF